MKPKDKYDNMTASDLARITRERGLSKPDVITLREWADFLAADDAKPKKSQNVAKPITDAEAADMPDAETDADRDTEDAPPDTQRPTDKKKGK